MMKSRGVVGVVLCGGESSRMGEDKAKLRIGERAMVDHVVGALSGACEEVVLACGTSPRYEDRGLKLVMDSSGGRGPLEGIASCIEATQAEWALVLACDLPRVTPELPLSLLKRAQEEDLDVCLFESRRRREPLMAAYRRTGLPAMRAALSSGRRRVDSFYELEVDGERLKVGILRESELTQAARELDVARNLNTPAELSSERARFAGVAS